MKKAEEVYESSKERYPSDEALTGFYLRNIDKDKKYADHAEPMIKAAFPSGLQKVDAAKLKAPPAVGVIITQAGQYPSYLGFQNGQIIVALNDYKIENTDQYQIIRQLAPGPARKCTIWDRTKYRDIVAHTVHGSNLFGINFVNYPQTTK